MTSTMTPPLPPSESSDKLPTYDEALQESLYEIPMEEDAEPRQEDKGPRKGRLKRSFRESFPHGVNWPTTLWIAGMHVGAVAALFFFTWQALVVCIALHFVTACLGITLGYHRMLTHGGLKTIAPLKYFFSFCGMLSTEGSPLFWVSTHRKHHAHSDKKDDPHSPRDGFWWSHVMWLQPAKAPGFLDEHFKRWAPDLLKERGQRIMHAMFPYVPFVAGGVLYAIGYYFGGVNFGLSMVLWGLCMRTVACYHSTWFVNSATHLWGYTNYKTRDDSRNLWWVALLSYGEGWHNNHHAHQRLARHGHRWWEFDVTYLVIWTLKKTGLAWDVQDELPKRS